MPQNDFVPWATGSGANVYSQATYAANAARQIGVVDGEADPQLANNAWRQGSVIASMVGSFIAAAGYDARDNSDLTTLLVNFQNAITQLAQASSPSGISLLHSGPDTSTTPNQIVISTVTPGVASLQDYQIYEVVPANSITGTATLKIGSLPVLPLLRRDGGQFVNGDALAGSPFLVVKLGSAFRRLSATPSEFITTVLPYTPAGANSVFAFTPGVALSDITGGATSGYSGPFTVAQSLTVPAGAHYAAIQAVAAFRIADSGGADCRTRIRTTVQGGSPVISTKYQGVRPAGGNQIPCPISLTLQNLDPTKSVFVELLVDKSETVTSPIYDPRIDVQYG